MNAIKTLASLQPGINGYSDAGAASKRALHSSGRAFLRRLAADLGLSRGAFDIRSNWGGIAVSGEVTLHADTIYVQLFESCVGNRGVQTLCRSCNGRKDYAGGINHLTSARLVEQHYDDFLARCRALMAASWRP